MKHGCPCVICSGKDPLRSLGAHENRITVEPHWMYFEGAETTKVWDLDGDFWVTDGDGVLFVDSWPWSFRIQDWGNLCCLLVWFGTCDVLRYLEFWRWSARIAITLAFLIPSFPNFIATPLTPGELEDSAICRKKTALRLQFWISFTTRIDLLAHWCQHSSRQDVSFEQVFPCSDQIQIEVEVGEDGLLCIVYGHFNQDSCDMIYDHSHGVVWITCRDRTWQTKLHDWFLKFEGMPSILWPQLSKTVSSFTPDPLNTWQFHSELNIPWPLK